MTNFPTAGRRSRWPRRLAIALVVLLLLLVAADRIGVVVAQRAAAQTLQSSQDLPREPSVAIAGFPFLTQLAARDLTKVTVDAGDVPVGESGRRFTVSRLTVVLHDLTATGDLQTFRAQRGSATATVSYAELSRALGVGLSYAGRDRVRASVSVTLAGQTLNGSVTASVRVADGALSFVDAAVSSGGDALPEQASAALAQALDLSLPLSGLPFGLRLRSLEATRAGVEVSLTARDLVYRR